MATWIPKNKVTGVQYPEVDDAGRSHYEADPMTKGKYTFLPVTSPAPKAAQNKSEKAKAPAAPVGVEPPVVSDEQ